MNKFLLLLLFPIFTFSQLGGGNYVVGTGQAAPFNTLANAIAHVNSIGISGAVTFSINNNQNISSALIINSIAGSSATNTLTIRPNTGKTITISGAIANGAVFQFNGADNIIIDGNNGTSDDQLTVYNNFNDSSNTYTRRAAVWMYNTSNNNKIRNLILRTNMVEITAGTISAGIYAGGNSLDGAGNNSNNEVNNVTFTNVKQGVYVNGSNSSNTNWTIVNSSIGSNADATKPYIGVYFNNVATYTISGNTLNGIKRPNGIGGTIFHSGIYATNATSGTISGNTLTNIQNASGNNICYAIYVSGNTTSVSGNTISNLNTNSSDSGHSAISVIGNNATIFNNSIHTIQVTDAKLISGIYISGNTALLYNNMISNVSSAGGGDPNNQSGNGIYINNGTSVKLYFNSVRLATNQASGASACLFINNGSQLDIRNNVFVNAQTSGSSRFAVYSNVTNTASFTNINYNDYVSTQYIGTWGNFYSSGNLKTTLAQWQTATTKDANSISVAPSFISATDLHLSALNTAFDDKGQTITGFTTDIDGDVRTATPDMGADEYSRCSGGTTTWTTAWSNGTPSSTVKAIIDGNYNTTTNGGFVACELAVNTGKTLTIGANTVVEVQNNVTVSGNLTVEDKGSFVQVDETATSIGSIKVYRKSTPMKQYDYTYWSSPVKNFALSNFNESYIYAFDGAINNWVSASGNMENGQGYIVRAPENGLTTQIVETLFEGVPNTGPVNATVAVGSDIKSNLIGNPYPSAVNADAFITNPTNSAILQNGMLYFWTHNKAISAQNQGSEAYNYDTDDYAKYNLTGSTKTASAPAGSGIAAPNGYIASGQGFFVETKAGLSGTTRNLVFNNAMREKGANRNGQFYRAAASTSMVAPEQTLIQKNRVWLNITNDDGAYDETLLGYITGATNGLDYGYDGPTFDGGNFVSIYSILGENQLAIQGRGDFNENEIIPLGFKSSIGGPFSIGIENVDGFFANQDVFLVDKTNEIVTNLKESRYNFTAEIGTFNNRFELKFNNAPLGVENPTIDANTINVVKNGNQLQIKSETQAIASVLIYDLLGRTVYQKQNIEANNFTTGFLDVKNQMVIVKITTENNATIVKKIML